LHGGDVDGKRFVAVARRAACVMTQRRGGCQWRVRLMTT
jgi:hypothetical protein